MHLGLSAVKRGFKVLGIISTDTNCQLQSGKWRAQLVRDVSKEPLLSIDKLLNAVCHVVEPHAEVANFVAPTNQAIPCVEVALAISVYDLTQSLKWAGNRKHQTKASQTANEHGDRAARAWIPNRIWRIDRVIVDKDGQLSLTGANVFGDEKAAVRGEMNFTSIRCLGVSKETESVYIACIFSVGRFQTVAKNMNFDGLITVVQGVYYRIAARKVSKGHGRSAKRLLHLTTTIAFLAFISRRLKRPFREHQDDVVPDAGNNKGEKHPPK
jgi:hypothetical protein